MGIFFTTFGEIGLKIGQKKLSTLSARFPVLSSMTPVFAWAWCRNKNYTGFQPYLPSTPRP
jgi:hypothetical protein